MKIHFLCIIIFILNSVSYALTPLDHGCCDQIFSSPPETAYVGKLYRYDIETTPLSTLSLVADSLVEDYTITLDTIKQIGISCLNTIRSYSERYVFRFEFTPKIEAIGQHVLWFGGSSCRIVQQKYTLTVISKPVTGLEKDKGLTNLANLIVFPASNRGQIIIEMEINKLQSVVIDLFDLNGKRLISSYSQIFEVGKNHISIPAQLKSGVYILGLNGKNFTRKIKFISFF